MDDKVEMVELSEAEKVRLLSNSDDGKIIIDNIENENILRRVFTDRIIYVNSKDIKVIRRIEFSNCKIFINDFIKFVDCKFYDVEFVTQTPNEFDLTFNKCRIGKLTFDQSLHLNELVFVDCTLAYDCNVNLNLITVNFIELKRNRAWNIQKTYTFDLRTKNFPDTDIYINMDNEHENLFVPDHFVSVSHIGSRSATTYYDCKNDIVHCGCWRGITISDSNFKELLYGVDTDDISAIPSKKIKEIAKKKNVEISKSLEGFKKRVVAEYNNPSDKHYYNQYMIAIEYFKAMRELYLEEVAYFKNNEE